VVPSYYFAETFNCTSPDAGTCNINPDVSNFRYRGATALAAARRDAAPSSVRMTRTL
jgi:hypothetical protein